MNIYLQEVGGEDLLYVGAWNLDGGDADSTWSEWLSTPINPLTKYHVALVLDSNALNDETGKLIGYLNGTEFDTWTGANRLFGHGNNTGIGAMIENSFFHDGAGSGDGLYFGGLIDEVALYNLALGADTIKKHFLLSTPEPTTLLIWSLLAGLGVGLGWRRRK